MSNNNLHYIVSIKNLIAAERFDVGYFDPEFMELDNLLATIPNVKPLGKLAEIEYGFMPTEDYAEEENGVPLIRVTNIMSDGSINMEDTKYIRADSDRLQEKLVKEKDILMVQCGNTTGKIAIVPKEFEGYAYASFCFRIRPTTNEVLPEYLFAILQSEIGYKQVWRSITYATVRPNTTKPYTQAIKIPVPDLATQETIAQVSKKASLEATRLRKEAERVVLESKAQISRTILGEPIK